MGKSKSVNTKTGWKDTKYITELAETINVYMIDKVYFRS